MSAGCAETPAITPEDVFAAAEGCPHMSRDRGELMWRFIGDHRIRNVLELGFKYGVSTCYIAAAIAARGPGRVVTMDLAHRVRDRPGIEDHLSRLNLRDRVTIFYEHTTYNWRLREFLRMTPPPMFDLVFIDGAHSWEADALAFLLSMRLLQPGGWIVFDDLNWNYGISPYFKDKPITRLMPEDERTTSHIREVFEILVKTHREIAETHDDGIWAYARKNDGVPVVNGRRIWKILARSAQRVRKHAIATQAVRTT